MNSLTVTRMVIGIAAAIIAIAYFLVKCIFKNKTITTKFISRTAIFAAISTILYVIPGLKFPIPIFPTFLELHFDEVPLLIAGFAYGPWSAILCIIIKGLIKMPLSTTMCVGELTDILYSIAFVIPAAIIYKRHRKFKGALIGSAVGMATQLLVSCFFTTFVILDFYMLVMNIPKEGILGMCKAAGINIDSLSWPFLYSVALPFNLLKDAIIVGITLLIYKKIHLLIEKIIK